MISRTVYTNLQSNLKADRYTINCNRSMEYIDMFQVYYQYYWTVGLYIADIAATSIDSHHHNYMQASPWNTSVIQINIK